MSLISAFQDPSPVHQKRSIRAHRKSRGGCVACRARKVKVGRDHRLSYSIINESLTVLGNETVLHKMRAER